MEKEYFQVGWYVFILLRFAIKNYKKLRAMMRYRYCYKNKKSLYTQLYIYITRKCILFVLIEFLTLYLFINFIVSLIFC